MQYALYIVQFYLFCVKYQQMVKWCAPADGWVHFYISQ